MSQGTGKFTVLYTGSDEPAKSYEKEGIFIGRLDTCEVVLDRRSVSRIHAGITFHELKFSLANLSSSNVLSLNGRQLRSKQSDVLADGDTIQVGQFIIRVAIDGPTISLAVHFVERDIEPGIGLLPELGAPEAASNPSKAGVVTVFWEKRSRDKDEWGSRLRPTKPPVPGKAAFNWKPTGDLRRRWRVGLFVWAVLIVGAIGTFAYLRYPGVYAPKPISNPHASRLETTVIAATSNGNSCTFCHVRNEPIENGCIRCHQAEEFHASNTKAHQDAGITCTVCHKEHQGNDYDMTAAAIQGCAQCHNDSNLTTYNGKRVRTPHDGTYGYPVVNGVWKWKGLFRENADAIREISSSATDDKDDQAKLTRQFHTVHVYRLNAPDGLKGDKRGLVTCSTCHNFSDPNDKKPRQTCAVCHTTTAGNRDNRFALDGPNCISCHVQHPYSARRWSEFLTVDALDRRKDAVTEQIKQLNSQ